MRRRRGRKGKEEEKKLGEREPNDKTLALRQQARRRRYHNLADMTTDEAEMMRSDAVRALNRIVGGGDGCSDADWVGIASEIVQLTSMRVKMLEMDFTAFEGVDVANRTEVRRWLYGFRAEIYLFTVGCLEYPDKTSEAIWTLGGELYNKTYSRCRDHHNRLLVPKEGVSLLPEEMEQGRAVEELDSYNG